MQKQISFVYYDYQYLFFLINQQNLKQSLNL